MGFRNKQRWGIWKLDPPPPFRTLNLGHRYLFRVTVIAKSLDSSTTGVPEDAISKPARVNNFSVDVGMQMLENNEIFSWRVHCLPAGTRGSSDENGERLHERYDVQLPNLKYEVKRRLHVFLSDEDRVFARKYLTIFRQYANLSIFDAFFLRTYTYGVLRTRKLVHYKLQCFYKDFTRVSNPFWSNIFGWRKCLIEVKLHPTFIPTKMLDQKLNWVTNIFVL